MATSTPTHLEPVQEAVLAGDVSAAAAALAPILSRDPSDHEPRYWLASALRMAGDTDGAARALDDARALHAVALTGPMNVDVRRCAHDGAYAEEVANALYSQHHVAAASLFHGMSIAAGHVTPAGLLGYALALQHQGRVEESIQVFEAAVETFPSASVHQFLLYPHLLLKDPRRYADAARRWAALYAPAGEAQPFVNGSSAGRKLRIGYVAPSFATSQVRQFLAPVLAAHDPDRGMTGSTGTTAATPGRLLAPAPCSRCRTSPYSSNCLTAG